MNILIIVNQNFHGLYTPIVETLEKKGHAITLLEIGKVAKFAYSGSGQRIKNFFLKNLLGRNLKQEGRAKLTYAYLEALHQKKGDKYFDLIVVNHPDTCNPENIQQLKKLSKTLSAHLWDSYGKEPQFFANLNAYDNVISFDPVDAERYGYSKTTNYLNDNVHPLPIPTPYKHDVFSVMSYDKTRYKYIERLIDANPSVNFDITFYVQSEHRRKHIKHPRIQVIDTPLSGQQLLNRITSSRALLDIGHENQHGLSFRVFEALGHERKLITTNVCIKDYPFYNENNICCISDQDVRINNDFFDTTYEKIDHSIVDQYRLNHWVDDYLRKLTHESPHR